MKPLSAALIFVGFLTIPAFGQSTHTQPRFESVKSVKYAEQSTPNVREVTVDELNEILRNHSNLHNEYISLFSIGNAASVPLLIERLRQDYGATEPVSRPGALVGFDCAQVHLIEALRAITNSDQGMYYPRWDAWWQKNQGFSRQRWTLDGFAAAGLHVSEPVDDRFALELIELVGHDRAQLAFNARRSLANISADQRIRWAALASASPERFRRLGAVSILTQLNGKDAEDLLRGLSSDTDVEIRREALSALNETLRVPLGAPPETARILFSGTKDNWIRGLTFSGDALIAAFYNGDVKAFDVHTSQQLWTRKMVRGTGDQIVTVGDRIVLASQEGELAALDRDGQVLWHKRSRAKNDQVRRLVPFGQEVLVVGLETLERVDLKTGETKLRIGVEDFVTDADVDANLNHFFFSDKGGLHTSDNSAVPIPSATHATGISVSSDSVCLTSGGERNTVTCLDSGTLSLRWAQPIAGDGTWGHSVAPIQDGPRVLVPTDQDLTAFSAADGSLQWTTVSSQDAQGTILPTGFGFLIENIHHELELRNPVNGELLRNWSQIGGIMRITAHQHFAVIADFDGNLWLVDIGARSQ